MIVIIVEMVDISAQIEAHMILLGMILQTNEIFSITLITGGDERSFSSSFPVYSPSLMCLSLIEQLNKVTIGGRF